MSRRIGAPYPAFLALVGVALAFAPGIPRVQLDPDLALALFLAPVLVDAAFDLSIRELKRDWAAVTGLVVGAVVATTAATAAVAHWLAPAMPWAAAIALGAIVAPPDAVAASTVLRHVNPPRRLVALLESESLLNDASALVIFRGAVVAAASTTLAPSMLPMLAASVPLSLVAGAGLAVVSSRVISRIEDAPTSVLVQFVTSFAVWILAERLHLSGVLTLVAFAATASRLTRTPARLRLPSYAVWETVVFLVNVLAFVLIGLQIEPILEDLSRPEQIAYLKIAALVLATVVVVRFVWVFLNGFAVYLYGRWRGFTPINPAVRPNWRSGLIVSWSGMRGIVTLAAALSLGADFPQRNLIVFCAFFVVIGTLVLQGFTLGPLLRRLDLPEDRQFENEIGHARTEALRAALDSLRGEVGEASKRVRAEYEGLLAIADSEPDAYAPATSHEDRLRQRAVEAAREKLTQMRRSGEIGDDAFHRIEEELDRTELAVIEPSA